MTPDDWRRMEPLLVKIRTMTAAILSFAVISLIGVTMQRGADMQFMRESVVNNERAVKRIEASLKTLTDFVGELRAAQKRPEARK